MSTDPSLEVEFLPLEAEFISPSSSMREACEGGISDFQGLVKKVVQILPGTSLCLSLSCEALYQSSATLRFSRRHHDEKRVEKWVREFTEESSPLASASLSVGAFG